MEGALSGGVARRVYVEWGYEHPLERWLRDRVVLSVAGKARAQRLEVAWGRVSGARPTSD